MVVGSSPVAVTSTSDFSPASSKVLLGIQATTECRFTLKRICDMTKTYRLIMIIDFKKQFLGTKYRFEIIAQTRNKNLNYMIDPTFRNINRLFVISFKNGNNDSRINSLHNYYMTINHFLISQ